MKLLWLLMVFAAVASAQPRWAEGGGFPRSKTGLDLNETQQKQFDKLHSDLQRNQIALRSRIEALRVDIKDAFREEKPDRGKIESKMSEVTKLQNERKLNRLGLWFDLNKILTAEQQKIWKEHRGPAGRHRRGGPMRGGARGGPCLWCD